MDKKNTFDDNLKSTININNYHFEPSRNVFEDSWTNKDVNANTKIHLLQNPFTKPAIAAACCIILSFATIMTLSPSGRAFAKDAYDAIKNIFIVEESSDNYKVVEKPNNTIIKYENIGGINITDSNQKEMESRFGYSFYFPEKLNDKFTKSDIPLAGVTIYDIPYNEIDTLKDKFLKAITDEKTFQELNRFKMNLYTASSYLDKNYDKHYIYSNKYIDESKLTFIKEFYIEDIKCRILERNNPKYPLKCDGNWYLDDCTQKPTDISKTNYISWDYKGVNYKVTTHYGDFNLKYGNPIKLAEEYIKMLKQQK